MVRPHCQTFQFVMLPHMSHIASTYPYSSFRRVILTISKHWQCFDLGKGPFLPSTFLEHIIRLFCSRHTLIHAITGTTVTFKHPYYVRWIFCIGSTDPIVYRDTACSEHISMLCFRIHSSHARHEHLCFFDSSFCFYIDFVYKIQDFFK